MIRKYAAKMDKKYHNYWTVWLSFEIKDIETAKKVIYQNSRRKYPCVNLPIILTEFINNYHKPCYFDGPDETGDLIGIEITNEDYYYMYLVDGKVKYESCVGWCRPIENCGFEV